MNKYFLLLCLMVSFTILSAQRPIRRPNTSTETERESPKKTIEEGSAFKDKLWYGGNFTLFFGSNNFESSFAFGLAPMVGYKITPDFSIGPRVEVIYNFYKTSITGPVEKFNLFSVGVGPFVRYKFFNVIFAQAEYQLEFVQRPVLTINGDLVKSTFNNNNFFVGLGYNAGGGEILVLYNLLEPSGGTLNIPISFRFGFTYKF
ncbi:MAG: hypothetical protein IPI60_20450 [Saprospiraceae bacterium]|jgi:hypothetical protein|nr:hypothetical protein [Saprospiraceae bacterium]